MLKICQQQILVILYQYLIENNLITKQTNWKKKGSNHFIAIQSDHADKFVYLGIRWIVDRNYVVPYLCLANQVLTAALDDGDEPPENYEILLKNNQIEKIILYRNSFEFRPNMDYLSNITPEILPPQVKYIAQLAQNSAWINQAALQQFTVQAKDLAQIIQTWSLFATFFIEKELPVNDDLNPMLEPVVGDILLLWQQHFLPTINRFQAA